MKRYSEQELRRLATDRDAVEYSSRRRNLPPDVASAYLQQLGHSAGAYGSPVRKMGLAEAKRRLRGVEAAQETARRREARMLKTDLPPRDSVQHRLAFDRAWSQILRDPWR